MYEGYYFDDELEDEEGDEDESLKSDQTEEIYRRKENR
jgi:hypothetical protein